MFCEPGASGNLFHENMDAAAVFTDIFKNGKRQVSLKRYGYWERWKSEEYPAIARRAEAENAGVYWADETGVSNCEIVERSFSPKGRPPALPVETKRQRATMISAISRKGSVRFMI